MTASGLLASCIMFPIGGGEPHPFGKKRMAFIEPGTTQGADVRRAFGEPDICCGGRWWLYRATKKGSDWFIIAGGGYVADWAVIEGGSTSYQLLVGFHADGTVWRYGVLRGDEPCDSRRGVCYQRGKVFVELDPQAPPLDDPNCGVTYRREDRELFGCIFDP